MSADDDKLVRALQLQSAGQLDAAMVLFNELLAATPGHAPALYSLGVIALNVGRGDEALALSERGIRSAPAFAPMRFVHGAALQALGRKTEALESYDAALAIQPDFVDVLLNSGVLLRDMLRHKESLERFNQVLRINPDHRSALANTAILLTEFKHSDKAIPMFERLLTLDPDYDYGLGLLAYEQLHICDWSRLADLTPRILDGVRVGKRVCKTLALMAISDSASDHLLAAKTFAAHFYPKAKRSLWNGERYRHDRIRVAYVSPDLREHPVGHLIAGVLERHDKNRFETIAISLGVDDQSRLRARMLKAFDRFIDVRQYGAPQVAELMREMEVDIAIDLAGYTSDSRADIFAHRPAPVQVNYLGYPGTMGTDYMDYILADRYLIPPEHRQYYTEKVVYLPDSYLPTDAGVKISERTPTRAECGLPEDGVVFCSFSHDYKISPRMFDVWMGLLREVPGSVLWLVARGELGQKNLRREAEQRQVDPSRLVFAGRVPLVEDHLARYRQADLFLDTFPYNAHTTSADALMAGLPVITCMGDAFPARVAAGVLHAHGLPELVTHSLEDYAKLALDLARSPERLTALKAKVIANKQTGRLFDTDGFCRNLEAVYIAMWRAAQLGGAADALAGAA